MIGADYVRTMARYNAWQNRSLYREADKLTDGQRKEDRGAFFRSVHGTLGHLVWGDTVWMSRFDGWDKPTWKPNEGEMVPWDELKALRLAADDRIMGWAEGLTDADLAGDLAWYSGVLKADTSAPKWITVAHFFNHQTHHRGQAHALLTGSGMTPDDTDLFLMPKD